MTLARRLAPFAVAVLLGLAGGGTDDSRVGTISTVTPALCIAEPAAAGVCVPGGDAAGHQGGDCVAYVYRDGATPAISEVETVDAADHQDECPGG